jgi:hypothetical protein
MKFLLGALAALIIATPAMAQTEPAAPADAAATACGATQAPPTLPDGATADNDAMHAANAAYESWAEANRAVLQCRRIEVEGLNARVAALRAEYNAGVDRMNATIAAWEADVTEYNERNQERRR